MDPVRKLIFAGKFDQALIILTQQVHLSDQEKCDGMLLQCEVHIRLGQYEQAQQLCEQIISKTSDTLAKIRAYTVQSEVLRLRDRDSDALTAVAGGILLMETTLDPEDDELPKLRASLLYQESLVRINMGEISAAFKDIKDSIELYEGTDDEIGLIQARLVLAKLLGYKMQYEEAITLFDECYTKFERIMYLPGVIDSLHQIALFYLELDHKHLTAMEQNLLECVKQCEEIHYSFGLAGTYRLQAQYQFWQSENQEKALESYQKALGLYEELGCINEMAYTYHYMGNLQTSDPRSLEAMADSKEYLEKSLELFESIGNRKGMAYAYLRLSHYPLFEGN
ncbi:MAG: hypothetical protein ACXADH_04595, partial [Candidatus Kariarchaeaceae archaeon]